MRKVITDAFYKKKYIEFKDSVLFEDLAKDTYKRFKYFPFLMQMTSKKNAIKIDYRAYPSNNEMVEKLLEKRQEIYDKLQLNKIIGENAKFIKAGVLFHYLIHSITYDNTTFEDIFVKNYDNTILKEWIKRLEKNKLKRQLEFAKQKHSDILEKKLEEKLAEKELFKRNRVYLKSLYANLIYKRGQCNFFSSTYSFLLEGIKVRSMLIGVEFYKSEFGHQLNAILYHDKDDVKKYFIADVTRGNSHINFSDKNKDLHGFNCKLNTVIKKDRFISDVGLMAPIEKDASYYFDYTIDKDEESSDIIKKLENSLEENKEIKKLIKKIYKHIELLKNEKSLDIEKEI